MSFFFYEVVLPKDLLTNVLLVNILNIAALLSR